MSKLLILLFFCLTLLPLKATSQETPAYLTEPIPSYHTATGKKNVQRKREKILRLLDEVRNGDPSVQRKLGLAYGGVRDDEQKEFWLLKASN